MLNYTRAIVTPIEGTTRDTIKEAINLNGYLINFIDTAGIRDKQKADIVTDIGNMRSKKEQNNRDIASLTDGIADDKEKVIVFDGQIWHLSTDDTMSIGNDQTFGCLTENLFQFYSTNQVYAYQLPAYMR